MQTVSFRAFVLSLLFVCFYVQLAFARVGLNDHRAHATIASDGTDGIPGHGSQPRTIVPREGYGYGIDSSNSTNGTADSGSSNGASSSSVIVAVGWQLPFSLAAVLASFSLL